MEKPVFRLYDSLTRKLQALRTLEPENLTFYSCGPTVYSYAHIGNFRTFLTGDLVVRTAMALGWRVSYVTNITDVGHLTADDVADASGEDRMQKALSSKEGEQFANVWDLAAHYTDVLEADWRRLNLIEPLVRPRATQHLREQIVAIGQLIESGNAYETPTGVYFSVESFKDYGKLSGNKQEDLKRGVREVVSDDNKRNAADFALWKKDDKHLMQWFSPWGWGFPGWHIECSVMARAYLGDTLDLHAGGEDLRFPHHECEIAQSESLTGKPFANHWMHTAFLQVEGEKMAKSSGNFYTVRELVEERGADPLAVRYALISGAYGKPMNFTNQSLEDATKNVERFRTCEAAVSKALEAMLPGGDAVGSDLEATYGACLGAMCDNLNTPVALAKALEGTRTIMRLSGSLSAASAQSAALYLERINSLLGIVRHDNGHAQCSPIRKPSFDTAWIEGRIEERARLKAAKDFAGSDAIRQEMAASGIELRDTPDGTTWHPLPGA